MPTNQYVQMCQTFQDNVNFSAVSPVPSPDGSPFDATKMSALVKARQGLLPAAYRTAYVEPLLATLPDVVVQLKQQVAQSEQQGQPADEAMADARSMADTLVGAVRDWGEPAYHQPLTRFEAVVSNLYRSFLSKDQRVDVGPPLIETVPPLVTFAATADAGPFTLPIDSVKQFTGAAVGVVSLPGAYAAHPLLWPALAHETGGHDVVHADPGLLDELAAGVAKLDGVPKNLGAIWGAWMDETAADVYGLLNVGPSFAVSLAAFFSALDASGSKQAKAGSIGTLLPVSEGQLADPHPVDLLRLYVAMGVVAALEGLSVTTRSAWLAQIDAIAGVASGGATTIDVVDVGTRSIVQRLPLAEMADVAKKVGQFVATAKLAALGGHSIQDIETWDDTDELAATNIAAIAATKSIVGLGDDAQLLAGTTIALLRAPTQYQAITSSLNEALDDSFARDPIFGSTSPQSALALKRRGRGFSRTPTAPLFPIAMA